MMDLQWNFINKVFSIIAKGFFDTSLMKHGFADLKTISHEKCV